MEGSASPQCSISAAGKPAGSVVVPDDCVSRSTMAAGEERRKRIEMRRRRTRAARDSSTPLVPQGQAKRMRLILPDTMLPDRCTAPMNMAAYMPATAGAGRLGPWDSYVSAGLETAGPAITNLSAPAALHDKSWVPADYNHFAATATTGPLSLAAPRPMLSPIASGSRKQPVASGKQSVGSVDESSPNSGVTNASHCEGSTPSKQGSGDLGGIGRIAWVDEPARPPSAGGRKEDSSEHQMWTRTPVNTDLVLGQAGTSAATSTGLGTMDVVGPAREGGAPAMIDDLPPGLHADPRTVFVEISSRGEVAQTGDECPPHGMLSVLGRRRDMEDMLSVVPSFMSVPRQCTSGAQLSTQPGEGAAAGPAGGLESQAPLHFFGIYDGHGGAQAARYCAERMHVMIADELKLLESQQDSPIEDQLLGALPSAFKKVDDEIGGKCIYPGGCGQCVMAQHDPIAPEAVGTTAVVTLIGPSQIIVGNCGDSRAVLSRGGTVVPLSIDHRPDRVDEARRVEAAGGRIIYYNGYRVLGVLAMSRAIGDRCLKPFVVAEPEVKWIRRSEDDECIVMGSDGLWDVMSNEEACNIARRCLTAKRVPATLTQPGSPFAGQDPLAATAAALLTKVALARGSGDNITVVVIDLSRQGSP